MSQLQFNLIPERKVWTVSELNARIRELLSAAFANVWIEGEISNFREAQSGHLYFTMKDRENCIDCVMWKSDAARLKFTPSSGIELLASGTVGVRPRSTYG